MKPVGARTYKIKRWSEGQYIEGVYEEVEQETFEIQGSVQQASPAFLELFEGSIDKNEAFILHTTETLRTVENHRNADQIIIDDQAYEIQEVTQGGQAAPIPFAGSYLVVKED